MPIIRAKEKDTNKIRECARGRLLEFLKSVQNIVKTSSIYYSILKTRNPNNYLMIHDLLGLSEDETLALLLLAGLVRKGSESYSTTVLEIEWKRLATQGEFQFCYHQYLLRRGQKKRAYFISLGGRQNENNDENGQHCDMSKELANYQDAFRNEVREILATNIKQSTSIPPQTTKEQESFCTLRRALIELPLEDLQQGKRQNNNPTPVKLKQDQNLATTINKSRKSILPYEKENNSAYQSESVIPEDSNYCNPDIMMISPHKKTSAANPILSTNSYIDQSSDYHQNNFISANNEMLVSPQRPSINSSLSERSSFSGRYESLNEMLVSPQRPSINSSLSERSSISGRFESLNVTKNVLFRNETVNVETSENMSFASTSTKSESMSGSEDCWTWAPPLAFTASYVDNTTASSISATGSTGTYGYDSIRGENKESGAFSWRDAKSLKAALRDRPVTAGLSSEELKIAQLLISHIMKTENGVSKVFFPKFPGQHESTILYKKPANAGNKKKRANIVRLVEDLCGQCDFAITSLVEALGEKAKDSGGKDALVEKSIALMNEAGLSENKYHQIRMFTRDIFKIKWGASLYSIQQYLKFHIPPSDVFSSIESLQVGSSETSSQRKFKECPFWCSKTPLDLVANRISYIYNKGLFQPSSTFSNLDDNTILTVSNIDKADKYTPCMVRILNEKNGNSGKSTVILGVTGNNANESHENLSKTFFSEGRPIRSALQMLLDDTLVVMHISLRNRNGEISNECCIIHCLIGDDISKFPDLCQIKVINTSDKKFLKSSEKCPTIQTMDDFSNFCLLRSTKSNSIIAAAVLNYSGDFSMWVKIGDGSTCLMDSELIDVQWKRLKGWEGSDNKMCSILAGHQGASSKYSCYCCIKTQEEMKDIKKKCILRSKELSNLACFQRYQTYRAITGPKDDNARRDECYNISLQPLLVVPKGKIMFAPSHTTTGNMSHLDSLLVKGLESIEKKSFFYTRAQSLKTQLSIHHLDLQSEIKIRKKDLRKKRVELFKFERIMEGCVGANPGYSDRIDVLTMALAQLDSQLKDLLEYTSSIKEAHEIIEQYVDFKSNFLTVIGLNQAYFAVAKVSLGRHQGGRNFLFRDARSVATQFDAIAEHYLHLISKVNEDLGCPFDVEEIAKELSKTSACTKYLGPISTVAESQSKIDSSKAATFKMNCQNFHGEVLSQYAGINIYLKMHLTSEHLWESAVNYGFIGRANEQGSESCHVRVNKVDDTCRSRMGTTQFGTTFQKKIRMGDLTKVASVENDFAAGRKKILSRNKKDSEQLKNGIMPVLREACQVQDNKTILYGGKEYVRYEMVKCSHCCKSYPKIIEIDHWMFTHMSIKFNGHNQSQTPREGTTAVAAPSNAGTDFTASNAPTEAILGTSILLPTENLDALPTYASVESLMIALEDKTVSKERISPEISALFQGANNSNATSQNSYPIVEPLSAEEDQQVQHALYGDGHNNDIIAVAGTDSVTRQSIRTLLPGVWLNDEVINCFYTLLKQRSCRNSIRNCYFLKSFFFSVLLLDHGEYSYDNVKRWTNEFDIFSADKIFTPVNIDNRHWGLVVASMQLRKIKFYDFMGGDGSIWLQSFLRFIEDEHQERKNCPLPNKELWELISCQQDCPQQENGYDCGVFCCAYADFLSNDMELNFDQSYVTNLRKRIVLSIIAGKIMTTK